MVVLMTLYFAITLVMLTFVVKGLVQVIRDLQWIKNEMRRKGFQMCYVDKQDLRERLARRAGEGA